MASSRVWGASVPSGVSIGGLALDYWRPDAQLDGLVTGYHRYVIASGDGLPHHDVFFPSWAVVRIRSASSDWSVTIGGIEYPVTDRAVVFGPTSKAAYSASSAGWTIGFGLTPRGWRHFARRSAADVADRLVAADSVLNGVDRLVELVEANAADDAAIIETLDAFLLSRLCPPHPDEARIAAIHGELVKVPEGGIADMAERLGMSARTLHRLTLSAFGFGPKLLVRRARFLRSLMLLITGGGRGSVNIETSYYDYPHFLRDCRLFLGMSPSRFRRLPKPLMEASIRVRAAVLGAPAQALSEPAALAVMPPIGSADHMPMRGPSHGRYAKD